MLIGAEAFSEAEKWMLAGTLKLIASRLNPPGKPRRLESYSLQNSLTEPGVRLMRTNLKLVPGWKDVWPQVSARTRLVDAGRHEVLGTSP